MIGGGNLVAIDSITSNAIAGSVSIYAAANTYIRSAIVMVADQQLTRSTTIWMGNGARRGEDSTSRGFELSGSRK